MHTKRKLLLIGFAALIAACESKPPVGPGTVTITQTTSSTSTIPASTATFALSTEKAIVGQLVLVNGSGSTIPSGRPIDTYSWDWGDGATTSGVSSFHAYSLAGVYTITLVVADSAGGTGASFKVVTVDPAPTTTSTSIPIPPATTTIPGGLPGSTTTSTGAGGTATTTAPIVVSRGREPAQEPDFSAPAAKKDQGAS